MSLEEFINNLSEEDLKKINEEFEKRKSKIPIYQYSNITFEELKSIVDIDRNFEKEESAFNEWFNNEIVLNNEDLNFLNRLISKNSFIIGNYNEEDLKMKFLAPLLYRVDFLVKDKKIRDFYEVNLTYKSEKFILTGITDFLVSKGLEFCEKPYFFLQEFKKSKRNDDPEPQLLTELISAIELNKFKSIKGVYIIGAIWNFVILEKLSENRYQYFVSRIFNSTNLEDLQAIYKNLLFVKEEIIKIVESEK